MKTPTIFRTSLALSLGLRRAGQRVRRRHRRLLHLAPRRVLRP